MKKKSINKLLKQKMRSPRKRKNLLDNEIKDHSKHNNNQMLTSRASLTVSSASIRLKRT